MNEIWASIKEEFEIMHSGKFTPYHIAAWTLGGLVALIFSIMLGHNVNFEGKVVVIDADSSRYSTELIQRINTSPYIEVTEVIHGVSNPESFLQHDRASGVLFIPKGLEKAIKRGDSQFNLGYLADYSNSAQNAQIISSLNSILPEIGIESLSKGSTGTRAGLGLAERELFNPSGSATIGFTITFVFFFSAILYGITVNMLIGRFKLTGIWERVILKRGPFALIARISPYAFIYTTVTTFLAMILCIFGQLRFAGNIFFFVPIIFFSAMGIGLLGYIVCWNTTNPAQGAARLMLVVPAGFIMGGALMSLGFFQPDLVGLRFVYALSWLFDFWRDFAMRGATLMEMLEQIGWFMIYMTILSAIVVLLHLRAQENLRKKEKKQALQMAAAKF